MKKYIYLACLVIVSAAVYGVSVNAAHALECSYLQSYMRLDADNNSSDVQKLQRFLNSFEAEKIVVSGIFDGDTLHAVNRFQKKYGSEILAPWGVAAPTGQVFITTRHKINELYCSQPIAYTAWEKSILNRRSGPAANVSTTNSTVSTVSEGNLTSIRPLPTMNASEQSNIQSNLQDTTASGTMATDTSNTAGVGSSWLRDVFSSGITLVVLLILLAFVIYAMVTGKNDKNVPPPQNPQNPPKTN